MPPNHLPKKLIKDIDELIKLYELKKETFQRCTESVYNLLSKHTLIAPFIHSLKYRVKDPSHLREKLIRKAKESKEKGKAFAINKTNLFKKIQDCSGVRILHLHTNQMTQIDPILRQILHAESYTIIEGPIANTWDDDYRGFFKGINISTRNTPSLYTSVHYIVAINNRDQTRCELQVRTLMEEVWGEVSHRINYPNETESISCVEQLKVLARITSSGTRLVDSIFTTYEEHKKAFEEIDSKKNRRNSRKC